MHMTISFDTSQPAYCALRDIVGERSSRVCIWLGSGLSTGAGIPDWVGLRDRLCQVLVGKASTMPHEKDRLLLRDRSIRAQSDLWVCFGMLQDALGSATYTQEIRATLEPCHRSGPPRAYCDLWELGIAGVLTLNLDRYPAKAYSELNPGKTLHEFSGEEAGQHLHLLKSPYPFCVNLHGTVDNASSWVLTRKDIESLLRNKGYQSFLVACVSAMTMVFVGIRADDIAAGGHLKKVTDLGMDVGAQFWLTNRNDRETDQWAESAGIRVIRYLSGDHDHSAIGSMIEDLKRFVPEDTTPPPVSPEVLAQPVLPPPEELRGWEKERLRQALNAHASYLLSDAQEEADYARYYEFCEQYDEAIYEAWYLTRHPPGNKVMGFSLSGDVGGGAFSRVYRATAPDGAVVAVKVLHERERHVPGMLESFRRGVRSMRILRGHHLEGVVSYSLAAEIPAMVVMEYIEGPNLKDAIDARQLKDWELILRVSSDLAGTLLKAHQLPERVLHRDIRPTNVLLGGFYSGGDWVVLLCDFDLSWHKGAAGQTVSGHSSASGYLAPEQVVRFPGVSTRHAAVDSFGVGMTMFYLSTGSEPVFSQHRHVDWANLAGRKVGEWAGHTRWVSLPNRYGRLIVNATKDRQTERWDMAQIRGELDRMLEALQHPGDVVSAELLAEEVVARADLSYPYRWDSDRVQASVELLSGIEIDVRGDEVNRRVDLTVGWTSTGNQDRSRLYKWVPRATSEAAGALRRAGWNVEVSKSSAQATHLSGRVPVETARENIDNVSESVARAVAALSFSE